jgi:hypothetical protein
MKDIEKLKKGGYARKWSVEQMTEAVTLAGEIGYRKAADETGIPFSTLRNYARRRGLITPVKDTPEMVKFKEEVKKVALEKAAGYFAQRAINLAAVLFDIAEDAVAKTATYIESIKNPSKEDSLWVKALVSVWLNAINSGQLLSNKPTSIEARISKNEHSFIVERITRDEGLARKLQDVLSDGVSDIN